MINVKDIDNPQLNSTATININVEDADDENPLFSSNYYIGSVKKDSDIGTSIKIKNKEIFAWDPDVSFNNTIIYGILDDPSIAGKFWQR